MDRFQKNTDRHPQEWRASDCAPHNSNPPFGYIKDPDNKDEWIVDEPAANVVFV